jgi:hypothetical protein
MDKGNSMIDENTFIGTGEFELRNIYVVATVEVKDGIVQKIDFNSEQEDVTVEADRIAKQLKGQPLSRALEVNAKDVDSFEVRDESDATVVLLEAFHRAVEVCLHED